jgi:hypothetical protein
VAHTCNPSYSRSRRISVGSQPGQIVRETLSQKKFFTKRGLVEYLRVKALSSNPSAGKKKCPLNNHL